MGARVPDSRDFDSGFAGFAGFIISFCRIGHSVVALLYARLQGSMVSENYRKSDDLVTHRNQHRISAEI